METATAASALQNKRLSRYRSVRRAALEAEQPPIPVLPEFSTPVEKPQEQRPISRAPSRYHRKTVIPVVGSFPPAALRNNETTIDGSNIPATTSRPEPIAEGEAVQKISLSKSSSAGHVDCGPRTKQAAPEHPLQVAEASMSARRTNRHRSRTTSIPKDRPTSPSRSYEAAREEARAILGGEYDRLSRLKQKQERLEKERKQQTEVKAAALRTEQARTNAVTEAESSGPPLQKTRKWTIGGSSQDSPPITAPSSPPSTKASQSTQPLSRKISKAVSRPTHEEATAESPSPLASPSSGFVDQPLPQKRERRPTANREVSRTRSYELKAGDGPPKTAIAAPQNADAPVSAVNAGERRVQVRFEKSKITLPVTPSTTVRELLNSASTIMSQPIDPRRSVLIETYYPLGLERPLRRYERVRDVMNSWDSDTQNYLMIMPESECDAIGLEHKEAPATQPCPTMLNLHHSQKPGKWERHWMILREDGQVTASKTENDGNATNAFHLSDFDVYMPTRRAMKKLKPPKKICFAIKSQQRSIMFESTENFVHFFSTNDKSIADEWYNGVQAWRSWYLVNVLDQGGAAKPPPTSAAPVQVMPSPPRPSTARSRDLTPYQLGTFKPLLDLSADAFKYEGNAEETSAPSEPVASGYPSKSKTLIDQARNVTDLDGKVSLIERGIPARRPAPQVPKTPRGLVEESRNEIKEVRLGPVLSSTEEGFTGKGLLARAFTVRKTQADGNAATHEITDNAFTGKGLLARKMSTRKFVQDSTVIAENTNDAFTGGGLLARKMSTKRFVQDNSVVAENTNDAFTGSGLLARKMSTKKFINDNVVLPEMNDAFTGNGLVSRSVTKKRSQIARPGQPLVDLAATSEFVDRSLLRNVEAYEMAQGQHLPVIDRSRTTEVNDKTGEV